MKGVLILLPVLIAFSLTAGTNEAVVWAKKTANGTTLEVVWKSTPLAMSEEPGQTWTDYRVHAVQVTNSSGAVTTAVNRVPFVITKSQMKPPPNWLDQYAIQVRNGGKGIKVENGSMSKVRNAIWEDLQFIDVQYEHSSAAFLYRSGRDPLGKWLFVTLTGVTPAPIVNTNLPFPFNGTAPPDWGRGSTNLYRAGATNAQQTIVVDRQLWTPSQSQHSELKNARITGNHHDGSLAVEVTSIVGNYARTQTNRFVDGQWSVSESERIPVGP
jgi:hypothetical protein